MFALKILGAIFAFCGLTGIVFIVLCLIPDGDSLPEKKDDKH